MTDLERYNDYKKVMDSEDADPVERELAEAKVEWFEKGAEAQREADINSLDWNNMTDAYVYLESNPLITEKEQ